MGEKGAKASKSKTKAQSLLKSSVKEDLEKSIEDVQQKEDNMKVKKHT